MKVFGYIGIGLTLAFAATSALAFQEQGSGAAPVAPAPSAPAEAQPAVPAEKSVEFSTPKAEDGEGVGTEVRIPGLGKLGVLPKMDFGLELLYGANEGKQPEAVEQQPPAEDLTVRGTLKHNF